MDSRCSRRRVLQLGTAALGPLTAACVGEKSTTASPASEQETATSTLTESTTERPVDGSGNNDCTASGHPGGTPGRWPMPFHDAANTGYNPAGNGPTGNVSVRWTVDPPNPQPYTYTATGAVVGDGTVFVARGGANVADDPDPAPWHLLALGAESGAEVWRFETGGFVKMPPVFDGTWVYVTTEQGVTAVDASDGTERWTFDRDFSSITLNARHVTPAGDTLYAQTGNGSVHALAPADGTERWHAEVVEFSGVAVSDDTVYAGGEGTLLALDASDGTEQWRALARHDEFGVPTVLDCTVFVGDGAFVRAIDATDGAERWSYETWGRRVLGLAVDGASVFVAAGSSLYGLDVSDGTRRWHVPASPQPTPLAVVGDTLYAGNLDGRVVALATDTGDQRWSIETERPVFYSPAVADGSVVVSDEAGTVYALDSGGS